jgi:hypothetical protein
VAQQAGTTTEQEAEEEYPRNWRFDEDGLEVRGKFVKFDQGMTQEYGDCPIVVLNVDGEERSVWLFHTALRSKFQKEVNRRDFVVGEQVNIKQVGEKKGKNRTYMNYMVAFPDAPPLDAKAIFGPASPGSEPVHVVYPDAESKAGELPESEDWN